MIPATSDWWLDHYAELRTHLKSVARLVYSEPGVGQLFDLRWPEAGAEDRQSALDRLLTEIEVIEGDRACCSRLDAWLKPYGFASSPRSLCSCSSRATADFLTSPAAQTSLS